MIKPANQFQIASILLLVLSAVWIGLTRANPQSVTSGAPPIAVKGLPAPALTLTTLDGEIFSLEAVRGKPIILNLWASWCPPCRAEMPALQRVFADYQAQGLVVAAVHMTTQDTLEAAQVFVDENSLTFPIPLDLEGNASRVYRASALPTTYFIGADGLVKDVIVGGPMAEALLRSRAEELLEEMP
ncbi:MAG: TlpA family protein disulfide reductase [Anaerolineae bacterium]|nr:TlpA family protein disulfide reductase [Anaerolineae bacterium]